MQKIQTWKLQNLHRLNKNAKNAKPRCNVRGLDWSGFLHFFAFFEPVQVLEPWMFKKPAQAQQNAKHPNLEAPKPAQAQKMQTMQNPDAMSEVRAFFAFFLSLCRFWSFQFCFAFLLSLCRFWSLGRLKPAQAQKIKKKQIPYLFLKNGRQIAELFHRSIVLYKRLRPTAATPAAYCLWPPTVVSREISLASDIIATRKKRYFE